METGWDLAGGWDLAWGATAVVVAALGAALGPRIIAALPEPQHEPGDDTGKPLYRDLAARPGLTARLSAGAAALALLAAVGLSGRSELLPAWTVVAVVGAWLSFIDWHTRLLPYALTRPLHLASLVLVALAALIVGDWRVLLYALIGNVVVFGVFLLINLLGQLISQPFGYGDVRLSGILGLVLGAVSAQATLYGMYAGFLLGAVLGLVLSRMGRIDPKAYAFGPYLIVGAFLGLATSAWI